MIEIWTFCNGNGKIDFIGAECYTDKRDWLAGVAELADALDLGSSTHKCAGSSPVARIFVENSSNTNIM